MPLLAPLALLGLLFVPLIVAFYMLRLRRTERPVSSTYLWAQLVRDVEANAPWQRLRRSLLLLLQLLLVLALVLVATRPFGERAAGLARDVILVLDASASMAATDVFPDRLTAAKRAALDALADLPADGHVSVVAAAGSARVVANEVTDRSRLTEAIESVEVSTGSADLTDGLKLAGALAARARGAEILVVTDDSAAEAPDVELGVPVRVLTVGRDRHNQAIVALAVRADSSGIKRSVFASVANLDSERVTRRLQVLADGVPITARDLALDALRRTEVVIDEVPAGTRVVEARLSIPETPGTSVAGSVDQLSLDDAAWAIVPSDRLQRVLLVGPGNVYLQNALSLLPNIELYGATPDEYPTTTGRELFDLIVFDGYLPPELPAKPILAIAPPRTSDLGAVSGKVEGPVPGEPASDEPLLRNVDLSRLHVAEAVLIELPAWARPVIPGPESPLLYSGLRDGLPTAVLAFDLRQSDLPLQVAWPILAANLAGELLGIDPEGVEPVTPGAPVDLAAPPGATALRVTRPDGSVVELPVSGAAGSVTFVGTELLGVYTADAVIPVSASPDPSASGSISPTPDPSATAPAEVETGPIRFAVDFFDPAESNIAPGNGERLVALGREAPDDAATSGVARDEWWVPLALLALALLMVEWLVYERDGARRLWAGIREVTTTGRFRRLTSSGRGR